VITVDSSTKNLKIYLDGNEEINTTHGGTPYYDVAYIVGADFTGEMDDIRIYSRVLTQSEISILAAE